VPAKNDDLSMITWIDDPDDPLPETWRALPPGSEAPGLLAAGGELTPERLAEAYRRGVFPWYSPGQPVLWWSPDPRMVLPVAEFRLSRSLRKTVRQFRDDPRCELRIDADFRAVISACAGTLRDGQAGTWIVPEMVEAYCRWHRLGATHSFETRIDGELVGGLYGVSIGRMFYGESMFSHRTDASKIATAALICFCRANGITLIDCQQRTGHLASLGGREIARTDFEQALIPRLREPGIADWSYHPSMWARLEDPLPEQEIAP
jgi:leucyl/phenylalanyl-tRNA--protein transferase